MPSPDRIALAQERLAARARRITVIRQRVIAATLASFVLAFGAVVWDGSMGAETAATAQVATTTSSTDTSTTTSSASDDSSTLTTSQS